MTDDNRPTTNPPRDLEEVVNEIGDEARAKAEAARDATETAARQRATEMHEGIQSAADDHLQRLRDLAGEGNRRTLVIERNGRSLVKMPLLLGVLIGVGALFFSLPLLIVIVVAGLVGRLELRLEPADKRKR